MKNKNSGIRYFILLTILSGLFSYVQALETGIQISENQSEITYTRNSDIEKLFKNSLPAINTPIYTQVPRGLIVSFDSDIFFEEGQDELKESAKILLNDIGRIIKYLDKTCIIEGNAKTSIIENTHYNTNWEISIIQAEKIVQYLIATLEINPLKIQAVGFGEKIPLTKNNTEYNQRIDFVILNYEKNELQNLSKQ